MLLAMGLLFRNHKRTMVMASYPEILRESQTLTAVFFGRLNLMGRVQAGSARMGYHLVGAGACLNNLEIPRQNLPYPSSLCTTGRYISFDNAWTEKSEYCYAQRVTHGSLQFAFHFKRVVVNSSWRRSFTPIFG